MHARNNVTVIQLNRDTTTLVGAKRHLPRFFFVIWLVALHFYEEIVFIRKQRTSLTDELSVKFGFPFQHIISTINVEQPVRRIITSPEVGANKVPPKNSQ